MPGYLVSSVKIIIALLLLIFAHTSLAQDTQNTTAKQVISIHAIDWWPQRGLDPEQPGYIVELE